MRLEGRRVGAKDVRAALTGRLRFGGGDRSLRPPAERWRPALTGDIHDFVVGRHPLAGGRIRYLLDGLAEVDLARCRRRAPLRSLRSPSAPSLRPVPSFDALPESAAVLRRGSLDGASASRVRRRLTALAWAYAESGRQRPGSWTADEVVRLARRYGRARNDGAVLLTEAMRDVWRARRRDPFARAQARRLEAYLLLSHLDWFGVDPRQVPVPWERSDGRRPRTDP